MVTTPTLWQSPTKVNISDDNEFQGLAKVIPTLDFGFLIVWQDESATYNPPGTAIVGRLYHPTGIANTGEIGPHPPFVDGGIYVTPDFAFNDGVGATVFVEEFSPSDLDIYIAFYDEDGDFTGWNVIDDLTFNNTYYPSIVALADDSFLVSYAINAGNGPTAAARYVDASGNVSAPFNLIPSYSDNADLVSIAVLTNGSFVAAAQIEFEPGDHDIVFSLFDSDGNQLIDGQGVAGGTAEEDELNPQVAALLGGGFVIAWEDPDPDGFGIRFSLYDGNGNAITDDRANSSTAGDQFDVAVTPLLDGGFLVVWEDDFTDTVRAQRFDGSGNRVGVEFKVFDGLGDVPDATLLLDGRVVITHSTSGDSDVMFSIWDPREKTIFGSSGEDALMSRRDGATLFGLGDDDTLIGFEGADVLDGGLGRDVLIGGLANDIYVIDSAGDQVFEGAGQGTDLIKSFISKSLVAHVENLTLLGAGNVNGTGNAAPNVITGNAGRNTLTGLGSNDTLAGGGGVDTLIGGLGRDVMTGGGARDIFDFNAVGETGKTLPTRDVIKDFSHAQGDDIDLSTIDAKVGVLGNQAFSFVGQGAFKGVKGQLHYKFEGPAKTIVEGDINGDRKADFQIELTGHKLLVAGDFIL
jgi:Ca2+-binding RTX toxin-like protein